MAIAPSDIKFRLSAPGAAAGDATAAPNIGAYTNIGKFMSTTDVNAVTTSNNLFPDLTGTQNAEGAAYQDYQCVFIYNSSAQDAQNVVVWNSGDVSGGMSVDLGLDTTAASAHDSLSDQALTIANGTTAPSGVSFAAAQSSGAGLSIGALNAGQVKAVWVRRTAADSAAMNDDGFTLEVDFDTAA